VSALQICVTSEGAETLRQTMSTDQLITHIEELFVCRRDVYAEGYLDPSKPNKYRYSTVHEPITPELILQHLKGETCIGIYPMVEDQVAWAAVDFDAPTDNDGNEVEDPFTHAYDAGLAQQRAFEAAGLHAYLERSRSGKGVHVWAFFDDMVPAALVRAALKPLLTDHSVFTSRDRMFPVQDSTAKTESGLGNLIALPYYGKAWTERNSAMLDENGHPVPPREWFLTVRRNAAAVIARMVEKAPKQRTVGVAPTDEDRDEPSYRPDKPIMGALKLISAYGCGFMRNAYLNRRTLKEPEWYAAVQQATCFRNGREFAHALSRGHKSYDAAAVDAKYDHACDNNPVGCAWIRDNYPQAACASCALKAPYHVAKRGILEMAAGSQAPMVQLADMSRHLDRVHKLNAGEVTSGIKLGFEGLDEHFRLRPGELVVVGGLQALGKTSWGVDAAIRLARAGSPVFVFSAETGQDTLTDRILGNVAKVDTLALKGERASPLTLAEWTRIADARAVIEQLPLFLDFTSLTPEQVLDQIETTLLTQRLDLDAPYVVFFDYLQFGVTVTGTSSEYDRLSTLVSTFKFMAKVLEHPVVVFSQIRRDKEGDSEPEITWFKGSGRIESDMDSGLIITGERTSAPVASRRITIVKQREGQANIGIDYHLQQQFGHWSHVEHSGMATAPSWAQGESMELFGKEHE
jgi:hypothetical protein